MTERRAAATAGIAVLLGALIMLVALVAAPGPWLQGYVSEAGTAGQAFATQYRFGLVLLALGVGSLGLALRRTSAFVALLLGSAALFAATSGVVPCSNQCPLPPYEPTTVSDVVHTVASIIGLVVLAGAMVVVMLTTAFGRATRRLSAVGTALIVPLGGALGLTMLLTGRGPLGANLERLALVVAVSWLIGTSLLTVLRSSVKVESWSRRIPTLSNPESRSSNVDSPS